MKDIIEVLKRVANTAGYPVRYDHDINQFVLGTESVFDVWNPLEYDDDAFRLIVDMGLAVSAGGVDNVHVSLKYSDLYKDCVVVECAKAGETMAQLLRRAIVKAVSELEKI